MKKMDIGNSDFKSIIENRLSQGKSSYSDR
jgi:hypothetical protein